MNALPILAGALCVIAIAYRYYSAFLAAKVLALDDSRKTPAHTKFDGHNYYPTNKWVLFGHHFAAISGAGPLIGPVLAAQFGFLPGLLWLVIGVCLGGAVHDFMILAGSVRRGGRSLAEMAREEISPLSGLVAGVAILFIVVIALAGLGLVVVNALAESPWGTFTVGATIPLALLMGLYMYRFRKGKIAEASVIGVVGLLAAVWIGGKVGRFELGRDVHARPQDDHPAHGRVRDRREHPPGLDAPLSARLPLLVTEDRHDRVLIAGVLFVHPDLHMPAFTPFCAGGGPVIPGRSTRSCSSRSLAARSRASTRSSPRDDAEDDLEGVGRADDRVRRDADGRRRRRRRARRGERALPRRLLRDQHRAETPAQTAKYERMVDEHTAGRASTSARRRSTGCRRSRERRT
jgi:carbon starvation protein